MYVEQLYTNCLAEAAYYVESAGASGEIEAAIIDPIRDVETYVEMASSRGARIKWIFETHFHADFVSGHLDLAAQTGATIVFGPTAEPAYSVHVAHDGERFAIGTASIELLHTPGHTPESSCLLLRDETGTPTAIFTGDTIFVGDVGRPDLLDGKMSKEALASMMYDSLQRLKALPDDLTLYPAHGPGSSCGKNIGKETWSTLGMQKRSNYAMQDMSREEFVRTLTTGLAAPPQYYFKDAQINKTGYDPLSDVLTQVSRAIDLDEFQNLTADSRTLILDTREPVEFEAGHIPNSVNVGLSGTYAWWVGTLIDIATPLAIVATPGRESEAIRRLARIGYENIAGYLAGGFDAWRAAGLTTEIIESIEPEEFDAARGASSATEPIVLDVRNVSEFEAGHVKGAVNIPLGVLDKALAQDLDPKATYLVHCAGGYRSVIAASLMRRAGFRNLTNTRGGFRRLCQVSSAIAQPA